VLVELEVLVLELELEVELDVEVLLELVVVGTGAEVLLDELVDEVEDVDDEVDVEEVVLVVGNEVEVEVVVEVVVVVGKHAPVFTSSRHWLSVPPSRSNVSAMVSVQTPFGFSPTNAASGSSGTSGVTGPLGDHVRSVTSPLFAVYGTCPAGFAESFQSVPLYALFTPGALSLVSVTIVPAGDVSEISRSLLYVCEICVKTSRSTSDVFTPETVMLDETVTTPVAEIATGVLFVNDVVLVGMACGNAVIASDHDVRVPVLPAVSSDTRSVHVPFGFSPMKAPSASSGARVATTVLFAYGWSEASPAFEPYGTRPFGSASSSHTVPLKTFAAPSPLSEVSVTTVPDGEVIVMSRSPAFACWRNVVTFTSRRYVFSPDTTIDDVVTPLSVSGVAVLFVNVCGVPVQATGTVVDVVLDVDVLLVEDDVELDVDELVLVDDDVEEDVLEDEVVDDVDVLEVVDEDVLVVVDLVVDVEVDVDVLVVVDFVVDVELDVEDDVVELEVLVDDDVVVVVLVEKSHPMSVNASRVRSVTWSALVYDGSII
jgi:hypothetical protein